MAEAKRNITVRVIRPGEAHRDQSIVGDTPTERLEAVWDLTLTVMEFAGVGESRLQRSVCRIQRPQDLADLAAIEDAADNEHE